MDQNNFQIHTLYGLTGAKKALGTVVVIDVFCSASSAIYALSKGARYIVPKATKEEAVSFKALTPNVVSVGEEGGIKIPAFDLGDSPKEILKADLTEKIVVQRTSRGTQGLLAVKQADELIFASFQTASAIAKHIFQTRPPIISLVALDGAESEDDLFAEYLKGILLGRPLDMEKIVLTLKKKAAEKRVLDADKEFQPNEDFNLCLKANIFNFIAIGQYQKDTLIIKREEVL